MTLANILTIIRILLIPVFLAVFFSEPAGGRYLSIGVLLLSGLTDVLDGYIARVRHQVSKLGKILDPVADKLFALSVLGALVAAREIPLWILVALALKEVIQLFGGGLMWLSRKNTLGASNIGKAATFLLYAGVIAVILGFSFGLAIVIAAVAVSFVAGLGYLRQIVSS